MNICKHCGKGYAHSSGLYRHYATCSRYLDAKHIGIYYSNDDTDDKFNLNELQSDVLNLKNPVVNKLLMHLTLLRDEVVKLREELRHKEDAAQGIMVCSNINNSTIVNNITVNKFSMPNKTYISDRFLTACVRQRGDGVVELTRAIHFNADHPENHNVRARSRTAIERYNTVDVFNGNTWECSDGKQIIKKLFDSHYEILDSHRGDNEEELRSVMGSHMYGIVDKWFDGMRNYSPESKEYKDVTHKMKMLLLSACLHGQSNLTKLN